MYASKNWKYKLESSSTPFSDGLRQNSGCSLESNAAFRLGKTEIVGLWKVFFQFNLSHNYAVDVNPTESEINLTSADDTVNRQFERNN